MAGQTCEFTCDRLRETERRARRIVRETRETGSRQDLNHCGAVGKGGDLALPESEERGGA